MENTEVAPLKLVVVSAGVSDPSTTRMLADRTAQKTIDALRRAGRPTTLSVIELAPMAADIARSLVAGFPAVPVQDAIDQLAAADGVIVSTPVYKAGLSGLFKSFVDILDNDLLVGVPVVLAATAGSARHAMVVDDHLRPLFAFLRAFTAPTSLFATAEDWASAKFTSRIERVANELAHLMVSGVRAAIADSSWGRYQHQFAGNAVRAEQTVDDVDFSTDLMRLATGGGARGSSSR